MTAIFDDEKAVLMKLDDVVAKLEASSKASRSVNPAVKQALEEAVKLCRSLRDCQEAREGSKAALSREVGLLILGAQEKREDGNQTLTTLTGDGNPGAQIVVRESFERATQTDPSLFAAVSTARPDPQEVPDTMQRTEATRKEDKNKISTPNERNDYKRKEVSPAEGAEANKKKKKRSAKLRNAERQVGEVAVSGNSVLPARDDTRPEPEQLRGDDATEVGPVETPTEGEWQVVGRREGVRSNPKAVNRNPAGKQPGGAQSATRVRGSRPPAIAVKVENKASYAEILRKIKGGAKTEGMGKVTAIRRTRAGNLLIELSKESAACAKSLQEGIVRTLGDKAQVRRLQPTMEVEVRDIDEVTSREEVRQAVFASLAATPAPLASVEDVVMRAFVTGYGGMQRAVLSLPETSARRLVSGGHVIVDWVSCRVRFAAAVLRCYRCHRLGHMAAGCTKYDSGAVVCRRCGELGHTSTVCENALRCVTCADKGLTAEALEHLAGSTRCPQTKANLDRRAKGDHKRR